MYPQHVWLLYLAEAAVLFPLRWHYQWIARPLRESYFWCDFCWVANFAAAVVLLLVVADKVAYPGQEVRGIQSVRFFPHSSNDARETSN